MPYSASSCLTIPPCALLLLLLLLLKTKLACHKQSFKDRLHSKPTTIVNKMYAWVNRDGMGKQQGVSCKTASC